MQARTAGEQLTASTSHSKELEWELQHARGHHEQADQAQRAALQTAQGRAAAAEDACNQAHLNATAFQDSNARLQAKVACLLKDLDEAKVRQQVT